MSKYIMTLRFFVGIMKKDNREVDYGEEDDDGEGDRHAVDVSVICY